MDIIISFWRIETLPCYWDDRPVATKIQGYLNKAIRVLNLMESERARVGLPTAKMAFVAPEHLFRGGTQRMAMPEADKKRIIEAVRNLSSNHPDTLIVPGTIVWLQESKLAKLFNRKFDARNSAFVFVGGSEVFRYDKHSDAEELLAAEKANAKFRAGKKLGVFQLWGKSFGLEVCYDHSNAVLYNQIQAKGKTGVDVHLILSSTVPNQGGKVAARSGGLLVHADGQDTRTSHQAQPGTQGAKTGIWSVRELDQPRTGRPVADPDHKRLNRGMYMELQRRPSFSKPGSDVPLGQDFQGFDDDVSVYRLTV
jgi:hypothetical protein